MSIVTLSNDNFENEVLKNAKPVVVDFWATWCGPCRMFAPTFHDVAEKMADKAVFAKLDVDEANDIAAAYKVMTIPTVMLFKDGKPVAKSVGAMDEQSLMHFIEQG